MFQTRKPLREPTESPPTLQEAAPETGERPRYELAKPASFDTEISAVRRGQPIEASGLLLEPGDQVEFDGVPGPHMIPLNDAARAAAEQCPPWVDPVERLPLTMEPAAEAQA